MFDVLTIAAVADELGDTLLDGRVQRIGLVDARTLAAEVYAGGRRHALVASANDRRARLLIAPAMPSLDAALVTPFGLLLRKYVRGGLILGVDQPPLERLVRLSIAKRLPPHNGGGRRGAAGVEGDGDEEPDENHEGEGDATYVHLAVEIMGRHSNLILIDDDGRVMESAKRVTPAMSRVRPVLPRLPYVPPPPIDKPDPRRLTAPDAARLLAEEPPAAELAATLVRRLRAVSPQMAREISFRVAGDAKIKIGALLPDAPTTLARETRGLFEPLLTSAWAPRVYREVAPSPDSGLATAPSPGPSPDSKGGEPPAAFVSPPPRSGAGLGEGAVATVVAVTAAPVVAFSPIPMSHLASTHAEEAVATISAAADLAMGEGNEAAPVRHAQRRERLLAAIRAARDRQERRLASMREQGAKAAEADRLREWGELIYGYLWQIEPGQTALVVDGTTVPLDPNLSAKENAQAYFERYRKAQGAEAHLPELEATAEAELVYLDQLSTLTAQSESFADIETLTAEWAAHGGAPPNEGGKTPRRGSTAAQPSRPKPLLDADGNAVYVGRSGQQNDLITFDLAGQNDTWLHARGVPGSHVVVRWRHPSGDEDPTTLEAAAALAAYYSAARAGSSVEVDATRRRHVRTIKGTGPGMVTYRHERTLAVRPADEAGVAAVLKPK